MCMQTASIWTQKLMLSGRILAYIHKLTQLYFHILGTMIIVLAWQTWQPFMKVSCMDRITENEPMDSIYLSIDVGYGIVCCNNTIIITSIAISILHNETLQCVFIFLHSSPVHLLLDKHALEHSIRDWSKARLPDWAEDDSLTHRRHFIIGAHRNNVSQKCWPLYIRHIIVFSCQVERERQFLGLCCEPVVTETLQNSNYGTVL